MPTLIRKPLAAIAALLVLAGALLVPAVAGASEMDLVLPDFRSPSVQFLGTTGWNLLAAGLVVCALGFAMTAARADEYIDMAAAKATAATAHADKWDGPTSGPKTPPGKTIVFVPATRRMVAFSGHLKVSRKPARRWGGKLSSSTDRAPSRAAPPR